MTSRSSFSASSGHSEGQITLKLAGQRTEKNLLEADTRFSAHVEQFLMEIARRQPLGDEALAQGLSESSRAAKPDIRLGPPG